jgi:hypothetical protein
MKIDPFALLISPSRVLDPHKVRTYVYSLLPPLISLISPYVLRAIAIVQAAQIDVKIENTEQTIQIDTCSTKFADEV